MTEQAAQDPNMPPVEDETATVESAETGAEGQAEPAPAEVEKGNGEFVETDSEKVQARINKITAEKYAERRERERLQEENERLKSQVPQQTQTKPTGEPKLEDFDYDTEAHTAALIDYKVNQKAQELQQQADKQTQEQQARTRQTSFDKKVGDFRQNAADYEEVIRNIPMLPQETLDAVMDAENGPQLAYYLGKHLDVADELATMSPMQAGIKLGQITAKLSATVTETKLSAAPDPIEPVESSGSLSKSLEDMSMEEIYNLP